MGYVMHETTDESLRRTMANRFKTQMGREYWSGARLAYGTEAKNRRDRRFFQIADQEYQKAIQSPPLEEPVEFNHPARRPAATTDIHCGRCYGGRCLTNIS